MTLHRLEESFDPYGENGKIPPPPFWVFWSLIVMACVFFNVFCFYLCGGGTSGSGARGPTSVVLSGTAGEGGGGGGGEGGG
jgi:hypothetical protein